MTSVRTSLTIAAPPDRVWAVLTDFAAYPQWNSVISRVRADVRAGGRIKFRIKIERSPTLAFDALILRCEPGRELAWRGGAPLVPALAWGEHWFRIAPAGEGSELTHGEEFGGLLALMIRGPMHARVTRTYEGFNRALKARAEAA
jgi:hypothetical protein